jgi:hypothetical protein
MAAAVSLDPRFRGGDEYYTDITHAILGRTLTGDAVADILEAAEEARRIFEAGVASPRLEQPVIPLRGFVVRHDLTVIELRYTRLNFGDPPFVEVRIRRNCLGREK